jgi:NADH-quinone oxidoreductase subunit N
MLVGLTTIVTAEGHPDIQAAAVAGILFYLAAYAVMNTGAFGVLMMLPSREVPLRVAGADPVAEESTMLGSSAETFKDIAGMGRKFLPLGIAMAVCCWSLTGLPFTIGFFGKFYLIQPALQIASENSIVRSRMTWLVIFLILNAAISAAYYLKIIAAMFLRAEPTPFHVKSAPTPDYSQYRPRNAWPVLAGIVLSVIGTIGFGVFLPATSNLAGRAQAASIQGSAEREDKPITTQPATTEPATALAQ